MFRFRCSSVHLYEEIQERNSVAAAPTLALDDVLRSEFALLSTQAYLEPNDLRVRKMKSDI